jgi:DNA-binding transcriptional ArsR family regulator
MNGFICAHIRRGDFNESCAAYDLENISPKPRSWVSDYHTKNIACWVDENVVLHHIKLLKEKGLMKLRHSGEMMPIYVSTNDMPFVARLKLLLKNEKIQVYTINDMLEGRKKVIDAAYPIIDISLCSKAHTLILNSYSSFSRAIFRSAMWRHPLTSPYASGRMIEQHNMRNHQNVTKAYTWIKPPIFVNEDTKKYEGKKSTRSKNHLQSFYNTMLVL